MVCDLNGPHMHHHPSHLLGLGDEDVSAPLLVPRQLPGVLVDAPEVVHHTLLHLAHEHVALFPSLARSLEAQAVRLMGQHVFVMHEIAFGRLIASDTHQPTLDASRGTAVETLFLDVSVTAGDDRVGEEGGS